MYKEPLDDICIDIRPRKEEDIFKIVIKDEEANDEMKRKLSHTQCKMIFSSEKTLDVHDRWKHLENGQQILFNNQQCIAKPRAFTRQFPISNVLKTHINSREEKVPILGTVILIKKKKRDF